MGGIDKGFRSSLYNFQSSAITFTKLAKKVINLRIYAGFFREENQLRRYL